MSGFVALESTRIEFAEVEVARHSASLANDQQERACTRSTSLASNVLPVVAQPRHRTVAATGLPHGPVASEIDARALAAHDTSSAELPIIPRDCPLVSRSDSTTSCHALSEQCDREQRSYAQVGKNERPMSPDESQRSASAPSRRARLSSTQQTIDRLLLTIEREFRRGGGSS